MRVSRQRLQLRNKVYIFFVPCGRYGLVNGVNELVQPLLLFLDHFEPIRDTIKLTIAATELLKNEKRLNKRIR